MILFTRLSAGVLLLSACIAATAFLQACSDRHESSYASLADASKAGEITRGWIPDYLPRKTRSIHIMYEPSSPRTWCAFEFSPFDSQGLKENLSTVSALAGRLKYIDDPGVSWWPAFLKGNLDIVRFRAEGFDAYVAQEVAPQSSNDMVLFAIDWATGRGFFYRTP